MKRPKLKGFTLVEMLIVMVIIGILAVVLTESYLTISRTALRVEQEKNLSEESLVLTQIFQSISDEATIDYGAYNSSLKSSEGFTDVLYLTGDVWSGTSIYSTGENCLNLDGNFTSEGDKIQNHTGCYLVLNQNGDETPLTSPGKVVLSEVKFKIIPYDSDENYFNNSEGIVINDLHQPAFWMFVHLYATLYQPTGINKIDQPLQLFFNLKL